MRGRYSEKSGRLASATHNGISNQSVRYSEKPAKYLLITEYCFFTHRHDRIVLFKRGVYGYAWTV